MFGVSCSNCPDWLDFGGIVGRCRCKESTQYNGPVRYDYSCVQHPMIIRMLQGTVQNWRDGAQ